MTDLHQRNGDTKESIDYVLLILVLLLVVFGLVVLYSTSAYNGRVKFADPAYYLRKQFFATSIGLFSMYLVSCMDYRRLQNYAWIGYGIALMLSTAVLFVGREYNGSKRWLALGPLSFQPSEYAKLAVVVLLAAIVSRNASHMKSWKYMFLVILLILPVVGLVGSNNLSTAIIILGIAVILIFVANPQFLPFLWIGGTGVGFIGIFLSLESYRLERLAIWRNPELYEKGYQTMQGLYAIGSGGLFGVGLGESMQKLGFVPEAQNDDLRASDLAAHGDRHLDEGSVWNSSGSRSYGAYYDPGDSECGSGDQYDSEYGNHTSVCQLWWYICRFFAAGDGDCFKCVQGCAEGTMIAVLLQSRNTDRHFWHILVYNG